MSEMAAAVSPSFKPSRQPSESSSTSRPKTRHVASRYLTTSSFSSSFLQSSSSSPSSSAKRSQSPIVTRTNRPATPSATNRTQSTGRRELVTPRRDSLDRRGSGGEVSSAQRMLLTSGRGMFATFQADSHENYRSKVDSSPRKTTSTGTPRTRSGLAQQEKSKLSEQWPRSMQPSFMSRSVDFTDTRKKPSGSSNGVARALQHSIISNRPVSRGRIKVDSSSVDSSKVGSYSHVSDTESVSSVSSNERGKKLLAHCIVAKARFEPGSPVAKSNGLRTLESPRLIVVLRKISVDSPLLSPKGVATPRSQLFPKRPASPSKYGIIAFASSPRGSSIARGISPSRGAVPSRGISPSRGVVSSRGVSPSRRISPLRVRSSQSCNSTPLVLNFAVDAKKEKIRENGLVDAHLLRLFHNRLLQWRFVNARANVVTSAQKIRVEVHLSVFEFLIEVCTMHGISISKLYDSAKVKRIEMQHLKQNMKLISILTMQMLHLEEWIVVERDYMASLVGAAEALKGSTLCLPLDCGATVNVESVKDAICSAIDVMQAMASSICLLLPKVGRISCLAAELGRVNVKEQMMLDVCRDLINTISALRVTECSLKTQALQLQY
ncbi:hypothetical protein AALP_AA6G152000 [Arabis alpina]|uniref:Uncharacterized protein n=1 Tax=Arabis alpina TaxID=50452 RepID=A0A087GPD2_ARAAL|nr:hypothetical protein AALP_AA6G152000 [Arabis alpina]